jgi:hypothetical protein
MERVTELFKIASQEALPVVQQLRLGLQEGERLSQLQDALQTAQSSLLARLLPDRSKRPLWINCYFSKHFAQAHLDEDTPARIGDYLYAPAAGSLDDEACMAVHQGIEAELDNHKDAHFSHLLRRTSAPMELVAMVPADRLLLREGDPGSAEASAWQDWCHRLHWYVETLFHAPALLARGLDPAKLVYVHLGIHRANVEEDTANPLEAAGCYLMFRDEASWLACRDPLTIAVRAFLADLLLSHVWAVEKERKRDFQNLGKVIAHEFRGMSSNAVGHAEAASTLVYRLGIDDPELTEQLDQLQRKCQIMNASASGYLYGIQGPPEAKYERIREPDLLLSAVRAAVSLAVAAFGGDHVRFHNCQSEDEARSVLAELVRGDTEEVTGQVVGSIAISPFLEVVRNIRFHRKPEGESSIDATFTFSLDGDAVAVRIEQVQLERAKLLPRAFESPSLTSYCHQTRAGLGMSVVVDNVKCQPRGELFCVTGGMTLRVPRMYRLKEK